MCGFIGEIMNREISTLIEKVREENPLVHNITNYVTVNDCANILLAAGASPIMADDLREAEEITSISRALVINTGTLNERTVESMIASGRRANQLKIPVVFDPVGAGASTFRNETVRQILSEVKVSILRGNLSEISWIAGFDSKTKGVDSAVEDEQNDRVEAARIVAKRYGCVAAITGKVDVVTDGERVVQLRNGTKRLAKITGTGCMTTALTGAFAAITDSMVDAAVTAILTMSIAGELAEEAIVEQYGTKKQMLGQFHMGILDEVSNMTSLSLAERMNIEDETRD